MIKVGITGGMGSGKTLVCDLLKTMGYPVYNSDKESKLIVENDATVKQQLTETFGTGLYKNGKLDKPFFASLIFNDTNKLKLANGIIHPAVYRHFEQWATQQQSELVFLESAILFESGGADHFDVSISVLSPIEKRMERIKKRDTHIDEKEIWKRMENQPTDNELKEKTNYCIINDGKKAIIPQVLKTLEQIKNL